MSKINYVCKNKQFQNENFEDYLNKMHPRLKQDENKMAWREDDSIEHGIYVGECR